MKTLHTPGGHNLDVVHIGCCMHCGGNKIVPAEHAPFDEELSDATLLAQHIIAMKDDAHFTGHPEWNEIVKEAEAITSKATGEKEIVS